MASIQLRTLIDNVLLDTSRDMREQADSVDVAFHRRVEEVEDAKNKLEENLQKVMFFSSARECGIYTILLQGLKLLDLLDFTDLISEYFNKLNLSSIMLAPLCKCV